MKVLAVNADLIVFISRYWQTTCTAVRAGDEGFVIDSPVYPDELEAIPNVLEQAGFPVSGLLATHGDWDHLLGRIAFPETSLGCGESTARRLAAARRGTPPPRRGRRVPARARDRRGCRDVAGRSPHEGPAPDPRRERGAVGGYSGAELITASVSPVATEAPTAIGSSETTP